MSILQNPKPNNETSAWAIRVIPYLILGIASIHLGTHAHQVFLLEIFISIAAIYLSYAIGRSCLIQIDHKFDALILLILPIFVTNISAAAHCLRFKNEHNRLFYDVFYNSPTPNETFLAAIAYSNLFLCFYFLSIKLYLGKKTHISTNTLASSIISSIQRIGPLWPILSAVAIAIGITAALQLPHLQRLFLYLQFSEPDRSLLDQSGGNARWWFLSRWFCWGAVGLAMYALSAKWLGVYRIIFAIAFMVATSLFAIVEGGRIQVVLHFIGIIPLLLTLTTLERRTLYIIVGIGIIAAITFISIARSTYTSNVGWPALVTHLIDWHLGRFSMLCFAIDHTARSGPYLGETYLGDILSPIYTISKSFGLFDFGNSQMTTATIITGINIRNTSAENMVLMGGVAESYVNFGWVGLALAPVIGIATAYTYHLRGSFRNAAVFLLTSTIFYWVHYFFWTECALNIINRMLFSATPLLIAGIAVAFSFLMLRKRSPGANAIK
jgi:hypothetical protein